MLKKVISVSLIMLFLFVSFAGVFANGHKHGNGEFIEEENVTQEYVAHKDAVNEEFEYTVKYSVGQTGGMDDWTTHLQLNGADELLKDTDSSGYDEIPTCDVFANKSIPAKEGKTSIELQVGDNDVVLNKDTTDDDNFDDGDAEFTFTITVTKNQTVAPEDEVVEIIGEKEIYVTGYKITSGKYAGYSVMFAEKVLKCTIKFKIVDGKEQVIDTKYTKEWHKLKCLEFGIYVKKSCKWSNGKHLFKYNKWMHKGKYVKIKKEESVVVEESAAGNEESITVEKESTTSNKKSGKRKDTMISIENNDYDSNGSSSNGSNGSNNSDDSSASDDTTAVNHTVTSNGLPKTGESASANFIFYCVGGLLLMVAGIILFRKKVVNRFMK
jgi:LPXTG-motif cell wall-anchored protein